MGVASNRQEEASASCWILQKKTNDQLVNSLVCRKLRGGRLGVNHYDSDQGRRFLFPYLTNTVCDRGLLTYLQNLEADTFTIHNKVAMCYHNTT